MLWTGLFLGIAHLVIFVAFLLRSVQSKISLNEVKSMKLKTPFGDTFLDIKLNSNRIRRVSQIDDVDELRDYIERITAR